MFGSSLFFFFFLLLKESPLFPEKKKDFLKTPRVNPGTPVLNKESWGRQTKHPTYPTYPLAIYTRVQCFFSIKRSKKLHSYPHPCPLPLPSSPHQKSPAEGVSTPNKTFRSKSIIKGFSFSPIFVFRFYHHQRKFSSTQTGTTFHWFPLSPTYPLSIPPASTSVGGRWDCFLYP